jgi:hypothetical protein
VWGIGFFIIAGGMAAVGFYWLGQSPQRTSSFYEPALLHVRVDSRATKRGGTPVPVMAGEMPVKLSCEKVAPRAEAGTAFFKLAVGSTAQEIPSCEHSFSISAGVGELVPLSLEYWLAAPDGERRRVDSWETLLTVIPGGETARIHAFESGSGDPLPLVTVPSRVIPYVDMAVALGELTPQDLVVVFFVERQGAGQPILQLVGDENQPGSFEANQAPLTRYREYGPRLTACAAWPEVPIILGEPHEWRVLFEVSAAVLRKKDLPALVERTMKLRGVEGGKARLQALPITREELTRLAYHGLLSEAIRVVRTADTAPTETSFLVEHD